MKAGMRPVGARLIAPLLLWMAGLAPAAGGSISTEAIIVETIAPPTLASCMRYVYPAGICFWITCTPFGCTIDTSLMAVHYNPDLVVTGYHRVGETPWSEMAALYGAVQKLGGQALLNGIETLLGAPRSVFIGEGNRPTSSAAAITTRTCASRRPMPLAIRPRRSGAG